MNFGLSFGLFGSSGGTPPIIDGDYIWYTYAPDDTGWTIDDLGNVAVDNGVSGGDYPGDVYASDHLALGDDAGGASVDLQTDNELGDKFVTYFDVDSREVVKLSAAGELGPELITNGDFSDEINEWEPGRGTLTASGGIATFTESGTSNGYAANRMMAVASPTGKLQVSINWISGKGHFGASNPSNTYIRSCTSNNSNPCQECFNVGTNTYMYQNGIQTGSSQGLSIYSSYCADGAQSQFTDVSAKEFINVLSTASHHTMTTSFSSFVSWDTEPTQADIDAFNADPILVYNMWKHGAISPSGLAKVNMEHFYPGNDVGNGSTVADLAGSDAVITGYVPECRTTFVNTRYGANKCRLLQDALGLPTEVIQTNLARFNGDGRVIDSKVAIDGTLTNFTMMMAFTLPENSEGQNLVASGDGTNRLELYSTGYPTNELAATIGLFNSTMTFDIANPVHAMIAVYEVASGNLSIAIDGETLSVPFPITFDGVTGAVIFGRFTGGLYPFTGYLGEGILTTDLLTETDWQEFWTAVKDVVIP